MTTPPPPCGCIVRLNKRGEVNYPVIEYVIDYCKLHASAERLRVLLEHGLNQMKKINGGEDKCVIGHPTNCPNHAWIKDVESLLTSCREKGD